METIAKQHDLLIRTSLYCSVIYDPVLPILIEIGHGTFIHAATCQLSSLVLQLLVHWDDKFIWTFIANVLNTSRDVLYPESVFIDLRYL